MAMVSVKGILTEDGKIEVDLPEGWQAGEIRVEVQIEPAWTDEEIDEVLNFKGKSLGDIDPSLLGAGLDANCFQAKPASEIQTGGWEDAGIEDSVEFVENLRRKRRERNQW